MAKSDSDHPLTPYREKLDSIDDQIVDLLGERFAIVQEVKVMKKKLNLEVYHPGREKSILDRVVARGVKLGLNALLLQAIFLQIFAVSKREQQDNDAR